MFDHRSSYKPEGYFRLPRLRTVLAFAMAAVVFFGTGAVGVGAGRYGSELKFDAPPLDDFPAPRKTTPAPAPKPPAAPKQQSAPKKKTGASQSASGAAQSARPAPQTQAAAAQSAPVSSAASSPSSSPPAGQREFPKPLRFIGTVEFRCPIQNLPKWERVLNAERKSPSFSANGLVASEKVAKSWAATKEKLKGASLKDQIIGVNKFFNQWPYKTDLNVWGVEDYWATPKEFVKRSGDCEDYAIAKYYALRDLGVSKNVLRVAAIKDRVRGIGHAILVVTIGDDAYVLDNLTNLVLSHTKLTHYMPQFSVNEEFLWRHVQPKSGPTKKKK